MECGIETRRARILRAIVTALAVVVMLDVGGYGGRWGGLGASVLIAIECALGVALLLVHATVALGGVRAVAFVLLAAFLGWLAEAVSLHSPVSLFGGHYTYDFAGPDVMGVPLPVPAFWVIFLYGVYAISNSFLHWTHRSKPRRGCGGGLLAPLIVLDGLLVVAIDLILDPLQVQAGRWTWLDGGAWFGVPIGNFVGWFGVSIVATGTFRLYEYFRPCPQPGSGDRMHQLMPPLCYGVFAAMLIWWAMSTDQPNLALLAFALMGSVVATNLLLSRELRVES